MREFEDARGMRWQVWATFPTGSETGYPLVAESFANGWLTFAAGKSRRRLVPVPAEWQTADAAALAEWLERAEQAPPERRLP